MRLLRGKFSRQVVRVTDATQFVLTVVFVFFAVGCVAGSFFASFTSGQLLSGYLDGYADSVESITYFRILLRSLRFHFIALLLAGTVYGFLLIPFLAALRGCFLSCSSAAIIAGYKYGLTSSLLILGLPLLVTLPFFFLICRDAAISSVNLARRSSVQPTRSYLRIMLRDAGVSILAAAAASLLERFVIPLLLELLI